MAEWDNFKALQRAVQDWQRQQDAFKQIASQQFLFEQYSLRSLAAQITEDARMKAAFFGEIRSNVEALEAARRTIASLGEPSQATRLKLLLEQTTLARNAFAHDALVHSNPWMSYPWDTVRAQMEAALRFFPSRPEGFEPDALALLDRLEADVAEAPLLGTVSYEDTPDDGASQSPVNESAERQLIEVVPAGVLVDLEEVAFAPLRLLHEAMRDPEVMMRLGPREFEELTAALVERLGIQDVVLTPPKSDGGRDVLGTVRTAGLDIVVAFECKRYSRERPVGVATARALLGTISHNDYRADRGVLVTTSHFTRGASKFILTSPKLKGADYEQLREWLASLSNRS